MNKELLDYIEKNSKKRDRNLKYDFMPNLLEVIERPAHIAGSIIIWSIFGLILFAIIWAYVSKVEVIVSATGTIKPVTDAEIISSKAKYGIGTINVIEGQSVKAGDVLIELNPDDLEEDKKDLSEEALRCNQKIELYKDILAGENVSSTDVSSFDKDIQSEVKNIIEQFNTYNKLIEQYKNNNFSEQAEVSKKEYMDEVTDLMQSEVNMLEDINSDLREKEELITAAKVIAPYDGVVDKIYIEKENISVYEDAPIISIIKKDAELEMMCYVKNSDIADIKLNQKVNIKLDAYPYSDYGTVDGEVTFIGEKADVVEGIGKAVVVNVKITDKDFDEKIFSGLSGSADMVVNKRRIIEYFIDPITGALNESVREK